MTPRYPVLLLAIVWRAVCLVFLLRVQGVSPQDVLKKIPPAGERRPFNPVTELVGYTDFMRGLFRLNYLERSLILFYFLRLWGVDVQFHLGVRQLENRLRWHAWLTQNGSLVFERPSIGPAFTEFLVWPEYQVPP